MRNSLILLIIILEILSVITIFSSKKYNKLAKSDDSRKLDKTFRIVAIVELIIIAVVVGVITIRFGVELREFIIGLTSNSSTTDTLFKILSAIGWALVIVAGIMVTGALFILAYNATHIIYCWRCFKHKIKLKNRHTVNLFFECVIMTFILLSVILS